MRPTATRPLPGTVWDPLYPDSDGRPMGDTDYHSIAQVLLRQALEDLFAARRQSAYVGMNLILYYERGNPSGRRDPDILVAKGVGSHRRRSFRVWEEKTLPHTLFEIVSQSTVQVDVEEKRLLYEKLRIPEYFLFDPEAKYMDAPLRGFRLRKGAFEEMTPAADGSLVSKQLGIRLVPEGEMLRLIDLKTGQPVLTRLEQTEQAKERARKDRRRAAELAAEVERLRQLLKERGQPGG